MMREFSCKEGLLLKEELKLGKWKKRWVVLRVDEKGDPCLYYYKVDDYINEGMPLGYVIPNCCTLFEYPAKNFAFELVAPPSFNSTALRPAIHFRFQATNNDEFKSWTSVLGLYTMAIEDLHQAAQNGQLSRSHSGDSFDIQSPLIRSPSMQRAKQWEDNGAVLMKLFPEVEMQTIIDALEFCHGSRSEAINLLAEQNKIRSEVSRNSSRSPYASVDSHSLVHHVTQVFSRVPPSCDVTPESSPTLNRPAHARDFAQPAYECDPAQHVYSKPLNSSFDSQPSPSQLSPTSDLHRELLILEHYLPPTSHPSPRPSLTSPLSSSLTSPGSSSLTSPVLSFGRLHKPKAFRPAYSSADSTPPLPTSLSQESLGSSVSSSSLSPSLLLIHRSPCCLPSRSPSPPSSRSPSSLASSASSLALSHLSLQSSPGPSSSPTTPTTPTLESPTSPPPRLHQFAHYRHAFDQPAASAPSSHGFDAYSSDSSSDSSYPPATYDVTCTSGSAGNSITISGTLAARQKPLMFRILGATRSSYYMEYIIEIVTPELRWLVHRRYSNFSLLNSKLTKLGIANPTKNPLPPKQFSLPPFLPDTPFTSDQLAHRRIEGLGLFLNSLDENSQFFLKHPIGQTFLDPNVTSNEHNKTVNSISL